MKNAWKRPYTGYYLRLCLVFSLLLQMFGFVSEAQAEESGGKQAAGVHEVCPFHERKVR